MTLEKLKTEVSLLAQIIEAPSFFLPTFANTKYDGTPNLEVLDLGFIHYIVTERNEEYERRITRDLSEVLFWIFEYTTFNMTVDFERKNRIEGQDSRILLFQKQEELLAMLNVAWSEKLQAKHTKLIGVNDSIKQNRRKYCEELEKQGYEISTAWDMACKRFPT